MSIPLPLCKSGMMVLSALKVLRKDFYLPYTLRNGMGQSIGFWDWGEEIRWVEERGLGMDSRSGSF